jgi:hypothetical protein
MRGLGISTLSIQTAGFPGRAQAEIRIEGIVHAEELRELIRGMVRTCSDGGRDRDRKNGPFPRSQIDRPADPR